MKQKRYRRRDPLLSAALRLRQFAQLEFMMGHDCIGVLFSQIALDMRRMSTGIPFSNTAIFRAFRFQFPRLFQYEPSTVSAKERYGNRGQGSHGNKTRK